MKFIMQQNSNTHWQTLYKLAEEFFKLKPWEKMYESDIFAIQSPDTGQYYFISIMGSGGETYSMAAYEGVEALEKFWELEDNPDNIDPGFLLTIDNLMLSFDEKQDIEQEQLDRMKQLGIDKRYNDLYPHFVKTGQALFPATPQEEYLGEFVHILREGLVIIKKALNNHLIIYAEEDDVDNYLVRKAEKIDSKLVWKEVKEHIEAPEQSVSLQYDPNVIARFKQQKPVRDVIEMDLVIIPKPVQEAENTIYFPSLLIMVNAKTGFVLMAELLEPLPSFKEMLGELPDKILQYMVNSSIRPTRIKYRSSHLKDIARLFSSDAKIKTWQSYNLPATDEAVESLLDHLE